jgi:hypothetical protein
MDPLSIPVSVLAVMGAAGLVVKTVEAIEHVPHELIDIAITARVLETTLKDVDRLQSTAYKISQGLIFHIQHSE